jgi:predicted membrane protein
LLIAKDKLIGAIIVVVGALLGIIYVLGSLVDFLMTTSLFGGLENGFDITSSWLGVDLFDWRLFVVAPMTLVVVLVAIIAVWIGYSMLTTPAPVPLEELEEELAAEEEELSIEDDEDEE